MFSSNDIKSFIRRQPFVPLRFVASSGAAYEVSHPDLVVVGLRDVMIGHAGADDPGVDDRVDRLAIMHIAAIEELPFRKRQDGNTAVS
jgi:hypothetical protein